MFSYAFLYLSYTIECLAINRECYHAKYGNELLIIIIFILKLHLHTSSKNNMYSNYFYFSSTFNSNIHKIERNYMSMKSSLVILPKETLIEQFCCLNVRMIDAWQIKVMLTWHCHYLSDRKNEQGILKCSFLCGRINYRKCE